MVQLIDDEEKLRVWSIGDKYCRIAKREKEYFANAEV